MAGTRLRMRLTSVPRPPQGLHYANFRIPHTADPRRLVAVTDYLNIRIRREEDVADGDGSRALPARVFRALHLEIRRSNSDPTPYLISRREKWKG